MPRLPLPATLRALGRAPRRLEAQARSFAGGASLPPPGGGFSLVEQVWHLADLEREGFGQRIVRLAEGGRPVLPDFDGERMARERDYRGRDVGEGLAAFRAARTANLRTLRSLPARAWQNAGVQDGVGPVRLSDIPRLMHEHDQAHRSEIEQLMAASARKTKPAQAGPASGDVAAGGTEKTASEPMRWHLLIHQLPPKPLYLRAKIRNRLARVGALALKNSVYVLPCRDDCLEDLQWIAQEAAAGGGDAYVCSGHFLHGVADDVLVRRFQSQAGEAYQAVTREIAEAQGRRRRRGATDAGDAATALLRLKKRLDEVAAADFFAAPGRKEAETMLRSFETRGRGRNGEPDRSTRSAAMELLGRVWVTRRGVKVDRIASAWLVRRFVDPGARFRFVDPEEPPRAGEVRFDMLGGDFTHQGDRCTFESLLARLALRDPALASIAEIVHDIDLKDDKYGRPDAPGVQQLVLGLVASHPEDGERLERGFALFDDLYASFKTVPSGRASQPPRPRKPTVRSAHPVRRTGARRKRT